MALTEKIRVLFEVDDKGSFGKIKRDIASADTAAGKMKAGASGLTGVLKDNVAGAALAAGTALVAFGVKSVNAFQDAALGAGKFADATGLAVEDASRWIEVAGDLGIEAGTIQGAFQKLNKSIADGKPALAEYGVEVVKTKDGVVDANATFINAATTIGAIEDPTKRAKAAQELFGKSYGEVAELLEMSASDVQTALDGVSDSKVIDEEELAKARKFRDTMDNLKDKLEDLALTLGESLVPQLADLAEQAIEVAEAGVKVKGGFDVAAQAAFGVNLEAEDLYDTFERLAPSLEAAGADVGTLFEQFLAGQVTLGDLNAIIAEHEDGLKSAGEAIDGFEKRLQNSYIDTVDDAEQATRDLENAYKSLTGELSGVESWIGVENAIDDYNAKINEAGASNRDKRLALVQLKQELINYLSELEGVPAEKQTEILALIDQGAFDEAERALGYLSRGRAVAISPTTGGQLPKVPRFDSGGVMPGPIGQHNLALVAGGETILPTHKPGNSGMGATYVFNVLGSVDRESAQKIAQAVQRLERERR